MNRMSKKWFIVLSVALICGVGLLVYVTGFLDYIPRLRASAKSPDGSLTVRIYQQRIIPRPFFARMGATAKIYNNQGNLIFEKEIYHDDDWDDTVGTAYNKIEFVGEEIRIGPGPYDPNKPYVIRKSDLH